MYLFFHTIVTTDEDILLRHH